MIWPVIAAVAGSLIDDAIDSENTSDARAWNRQQAEWELGNLDRHRSEDRALAEQIANREAARQKEFAQMGIRWKVDDARAAGLHPLAAIGAAGSSYSPTVVMPSTGPGPSVSAVNSPRSSGIGSSVADAIRSMGQNTTRAEMATATATEREMAEASLRNAQLRNALLEAQITQVWSSVMGQPSNPPAAGGTGVTGAVRTVPSQRVSADPQNRGIEAASTPLGKTFDMGGGASITLPSQAASESLESMGPLAAPLALGISSVRRWWHGPDTKPRTSLPDGWQWSWDPIRQVFSPQGPPTGRRTGSPFRAGRGNSRR